MEIAAQDNKKNYSNLDSNIFRSEGYVKVSEAANLLNVSSSTLRRFEAEGKISSRRLDNNYRVYDVSEVARFKKILDEENHMLTLTTHRQLLFKLFFKTGPRLNPSNLHGQKLTAFYLT